MTGVVAGYRGILRKLVYAFAALSAAAVLVMIVITFIDVLLRFLGRPMTGAYDLVQIAGVITIACALPYATAVKGHVAIEFFYQKLSRRGRIVLDSFLRILAMILFGLLCFQSVRFGAQLLNTHQLTLTLGIPLFWIPWLIAASSVVVILVIFDHLLHPGKEMIKP